MEVGELQGTECGTGRGGMRTRVSGRGVCRGQNGGRGCVGASVGVGKVGVYGSQSRYRECSGTSG